MDDILVATETIPENFEILNQVFDKLVRNKLALNIDKCVFLAYEINFLGYTISEAGIVPGQGNLKSISSFPVSRNFRDVQSFIGLTSYFRRFICNYALIAKPLTDMLRKQAEFKFGADELTVFETLKDSLLSEPVLAIYNPQAETKLDCDASTLGFGAILSQKQRDGQFHPVFYYSKKTTEAESRYTSFELELLCIVYELKRFRVYLQGLPFIIYTDCNSVKLALQKKEINNRILRWYLELLEFDFTLEHKPNNLMRHVDCLSRNPILVIEDNTFERILCIKQGEDHNIIELLNFLENSEHKLFELRNGLIYRKCEGDLLFYVPAAMEHQVLHLYHDNMGHVGENKTRELIRRSYWFPEMKRKVHEHISNCLKCIAHSGKSGKQEGMLIPIPKGGEPFNTLHVDHFGPLEKTQFQYKYVFVVIDAFTKFVKLYPCTSTKRDRKSVV